MPQTGVGAQSNFSSGCCSNLFDDPTLDPSGADKFFQKHGKRIVNLSKCISTKQRNIYDGNFVAGTVSDKADPSLTTSRGLRKRKPLSYAESPISTSESETDSDYIESKKINTFPLCFFVPAFSSVARSSSSLHATDEDCVDGENILEEFVPIRSKRQIGRVNHTLALEVDLRADIADKLIYPLFALARFAFNTVDTSTKNPPLDDVSGIWAERKFCKAIVHLGMLSRGYLGSAPTNITDEAIHQVLVAQKEVIKRNAQRQHILLFNLDKHVLWPLHLKNKFKNNKWSNQHKITCGGKLTYYRKPNEWKFAWERETQKRLCETQANDPVHAILIDPGIRAPLT
ncbi:hypothetical protein G9A89_021579 [Geosiphon pyriformis]|nr:hypothetical protein G9A89_021579 [Geosiphon pyriformis]